MSELIMEVKESQNLEEKRHNASITKVDLREAKNKDGATILYLDVYMRPDGVEFDVKYGCPVAGDKANPKIPKQGRLGKLLALLGADINSKTLDVSGSLVGKRVSFMVQNVETAKGTFSNVVDDSIKVATAPAPGQATLPG